jgi:hypothetical protein
VSVAGGIIIVLIAETETLNVHPVSTLEGGKSKVTLGFPNNS